MIDELKKIVFAGGFDAEDKSDVLQLEQELQELAAAEKLILNPVIKRYVDYLTTEADRCTYLLSQDRTLTELQRHVLFEKRDVCEHFTKLFDPQYKQKLDHKLSNLLDVAKNQNSLL